MNCAKKNEIDDKDSMLVQLKNEFEELQEKLAEATSRAASGVSKSMQEAHEKAVEDMEQAKSSAQELSKLIIMSTSAAKINKKAGNRETARALEKNLKDVARGRRRVQSVLVANSKLIDEDTLSKMNAKVKKMSGFHAATAQGDDVGDLDNDYEVEGRLHDSDVDEELLSDSDDELQRKNDEIKQLTREQQSIDSDATRITSRMKQLHEQRKDVETKLSVLNNTLHQAQGRRKEATDDLSREKDACKRLQVRKKETRQQIEAIKGQIEQMQASLLECENDTTELKLGLQSSSLEYDDVVDEEQKLEKVVRKQLEDVTALQANIARLDSDKTESAGQLQALTRKADAAEAQIESLTAQLETLSRQLSDEEGARAAVEKRCDQLRGDKRELEGRRTATKQAGEEMDEATKELVAATDEIKLVLAERRAANQALHEQTRARDQDLLTARHELTSNEHQLVRAGVCVCAARPALLPGHTTPLPLPTPPPPSALA